MDGFFDSRMGLLIAAAAVLGIMAGAMGWAIDESRTSFLTVEGASFPCRGMNWYGMEIPTRTVEGLWARDIPDHLGSMQEHGINTLRIPFALEGVLHGSYDQSLDPGLVDACASCPPDVTPFQILDKILQETSQRGMAVILDLHRLVFNATSPSWHMRGFTEDDALRGWDAMLDRYGSHSSFLAMDLYNEPHGKVNFSDWQGFVRRAAAHFGPRLEERRVFLLVNGIHWGEDMRDFGSLRIDPPVSSRVILSPHSYGPTLTYVSPSNLADPLYLPRHWQAYYGYLASQWPMLIGEWGGNQDSADDRLWMTAYVAYIKTLPLLGSCFWAWNPNSRDVRGYLLPDWVTPDPFKRDLLQDLFFSTA